MRKVLLAVTALLAVAAPVALSAAPASAATSGAPTTSTPMVVKGGTIRVVVNAHGSQVTGRTSTLWQNGRRVYDWSPRPGLYQVKSVITYRTKTTTTRNVWVPYPECEDYSYDGYDACAADGYGYWDTKTTTTWSIGKRVIRWNNARVHWDETPGCVSGSEFNAVRNGMTQTQVHGIFGTAGRVVYSGSGGTGRTYRTCTGDPDWSYVDVDYDPRVWFKWRYISY